MAARQMTHARRALVQYPYMTASQLWATALAPPTLQGFVL